MNYTVDTYVFVKANQFSLPHVRFISGIVPDGDKIVMDHEGEISKEYWANIPKDSLSAKVLKDLLEKHIAYVSSTRSDDMERALDGVAFDRSDRKFVGAAFNTLDKLLVAEESDYNDVVKELLISRYGISVIAAG